MKYVEPLDNGLYPDREGHYINASPQQGIPGSIVPAEALEHPMKEIENAIKASGQAPDSGNLTQLTQAIAALARQNLYEPGHIRIWGGTLEDIPEGWAFYGFVN